MTRLALCRNLLESYGYRIEVCEVDGNIEERVIRPDGSVAIIARKPVEK